MEQIKAECKGYRNSGNSNSGNCNSGNCNSGDWNSGDNNSGNCNSGNCNSGDWNSGDNNSGNSNSGYRNSGDWNSGYRNSGDWNSGYSNSGDWNSGDWNSCNRSNGFFNSKSQAMIPVFNVMTPIDEWENSKKPDFIQKVHLNFWVEESQMTEEEKENDPGCEDRGGQLRTRTYKEAWAKAYESATKDDISLLKALPNFNKDVFEEITGIRVD